MVQYAARVAYAADTEAEAAAADANAPASGENADFGWRLSSQTNTSMAETTSPATQTPCFLSDCDYGDIPGSICARSGRVNVV